MAFEGKKRQQQTERKHSERAENWATEFAESEKGQRHCGQMLFSGGVRLRIFGLILWAKSEGTEELEAFSGCDETEEKAFRANHKI